MLEAERLENQFQDLKPPLGDAEAVAEAEHCLNCYDAPCIRACPTGINIPKFIHRISTNHILGAAQTILESNVLGLSCARSCPTEVLCEGACVHLELNHQAIPIGKLQRYAMEKAYASKTSFFEPGKSTGRRVALVGAGPASLACAHELRRNGHETVIYEKLPFPGGLGTYGIAPYKMKATVSLEEIQCIEKIGVQFQFNQTLGVSFSLNQLVQEFDAVFLGMGTGPDHSLDVPGWNHPRIFGAIDFISQIKTRPSQDLSWVNKIQSALVIGGGNTAIDACRELKALGIQQVTCCYRRNENAMSAYPHEVLLARQEGVEFRWNTVPVRFESHGLDSMMAYFSTAGGSEIALETQLVLTAIGQNKWQKLLSEGPQVHPSLQFEKGRLLVNPKTGQTHHPKIYAGGDLISGGQEIVNAVAEGKCAATAIHHTFLG